MGFFRDLATVRHRPLDFLKAVLILAAGLPVFAGGAAVAAFYFLPLPAVVPAINPGALAQTSHVYAGDGSLIATFHAEHNRELIPASEIPRSLRQAVVASEDSRFYQHNGIDAVAVARAVWADFRARSTVQGGSTITQQYVKNAYLGTPRKTLFRKVREALVAGQLERKYSKAKILTDYLNTVYLGKGAYGVEAASKTYFNKKAKELTLSEAAMLVGLIPAPVRYSPYENPDLAEERRLIVLNRMSFLHLVDAATADQARRDKPAIAPAKVEAFRYPWFVDSLFRDLRADPKVGEAKIFSGGLQIYTSLDPKMQEAAERTISQTLPDPKDPHAAIVSIDPKTGYVRAVVGGRDYGADKETFNLAVQAHRSPGSSFKPIVLVAALEQGISRQASFSAPSSLYIKGWANACQCVNNYEGSSYGSLSMENATLKSVNTVYVQIAQKVGTARMVDVAKRMGISARSLRKDEKNLAISIGGFTDGVTPFEMASAYSTLAANGVYHKPKFAVKITNSKGEVLSEGPSPGVGAIDPHVAYTATQILSGVITSGTGTKANIDRPAAGKTGTSEHFNNAWFVGYTPDLASAVWMGYREAAIPMSNVHGVQNVKGGSIPAQMWSGYMRAALADIPGSDFPVPGEPAAATGLRLPPRFQPSPSPRPSPSPEPAESPTPSTDATPGYLVVPSPSVPSQTSLLPGLLGGGYPASPSPQASPQPSPQISSGAH